MSASSTFYTSTHLEICVIPTHTLYGFTISDGKRSNLNIITISDLDTRSAHAMPSSYLAPDPCQAKDKSGALRSVGAEHGLCSDTTGVGSVTL